MVQEQILQREYEVAKKKSAKPMLWISMISMVMFFAGLTSAYVISMKREDWVNFGLPDAFYISTALIVVSSLTLILSQRFLKQDKRQLSLLLVVITFFLGIGFVWQQYVGFNEQKSVVYFLLVQKVQYQLLL